MNARLRRIYSDYQSIRDEFAGHPFITVTPVQGDPPEEYVIEYRVRGLELDPATNRPKPRDRHRARIYLHRDYPRRPPQIIWRTPIFHPNILSASDGGGVCIGAWTPSESLADLVLRVGEMIQFRSYNPDDVLNPEAAAWAEAHAAALPVDDRPLAVYVA